MYFSFSKKLEKEAFSLLAALTSLVVDNVRVEMIVKRFNKDYIEVEINFPSPITCNLLNTKINLYAQKTA